MDADAPARWEPRTAMITRFLVGTYTESREGQSRAEGIFACQFDTEKGKFTLVRGSAAGKNPGFLRIHPDGRHVYTVNETGNGGVSALALDPATGALTMINSQSAYGAAPCYVGLDPQGRSMLIANYSSGSLVAYPIQKDGSLGDKSAFVQHAGGGPNKGRQEGPHAHSIQFDRSGRFAFAADLGLDRVFLYRLTEAGELELAPLWGAALRPGAGPRHTAFASNNQTVYVANELDSTVTACRWDAQAGNLYPIQNLSTLPEGFSGDTSVADIHLTPDGKFLYVSNRGADDLAGYRVADDGTLERSGNWDCGVKIPRNFAIDPSGEWLYAAGQNSNSIAALRIDNKSGALSGAVTTLEIPAPVCIELANPAGGFSW